MKKAMLVLFLMITTLSLAQAASHSAAVSWTASVDASTSLTYTISRGTGACTPTVPSLTVLKSGVTATSYSDTTVVPGSYCYSITAVMNGMSSAPLQGTGLIPVGAPTTIVIVGN